MLLSLIQKVGEYDQEILQPQTTDQPTAPLGRGTNQIITATCQQERNSQ